MTDTTQCFEVRTAALYLVPFVQSHIRRNKEAEVNCVKILLSQGRAFLLLTDCYLLEH